MIAACAPLTRVSILPSAEYEARALYFTLERSRASTLPPSVAHAVDLRLAGAIRGEANFLPSGDRSARCRSPGGWSCAERVVGQPASHRSPDGRSRDRG